MIVKTIGSEHQTNIEVEDKKWLLSTRNMRICTFIQTGGGNYFLEPESDTDLPDYVIPKIMNPDCYMPDVFPPVHCN